MYYDKLSNAFNESAAKKAIPIQDKYPENPEGFAPQRPEFEIVGAFASDPINISAIQSGNGAVPSQLITVTTATDHGLNVGTPVQIKGVVDGTNEDVGYNTSSLVQTVISNTQFTYLSTGKFTDVPPSSGGSLSVSNATVTVETDTVQGASPYIFNCSLRSVYGMNGMLADGKKATGFRSMVVAQFTGISLQKDDRAFVKYNKTNRNYDGVILSKVDGDKLPEGAAQSNSSLVYHLDSDAIYRSGWETAHVSITNDAILQIVSVFAIGYNKHFSAESGGDASITNSNSNFGQISLASDGFKKEAFTKDDTAYITSLITPKSIVSDEIKVDWLKVDVELTASVGLDNHIYLSGFKDLEDIPPSLTGGYRIGAKVNEILTIPYGNDPSGLTTVTSSVRMVDGFTGTGSTVAFGSNSAVKRYAVTDGPTGNALTIGSHGLRTGEKIRIFSDDGDLPENIVENTVYFAIAEDTKTSLGPTKIELAGSKTDSDTDNPIIINGGTKLSIESRVHDKEAGDVGSPIFYDTTNGNWAINVAPNPVGLATFQHPKDDGTDTGVNITTSNATSVKRIEDSRSLDDKLYKLRVVVPKEVVGGKNPEESFVLQESSSTGYRNATDYNKTSITAGDFNYNRNLRLITLTTLLGSTVTVTTSLPHNLNAGDNVNIKNVKSSTNTTGTDNVGYNGTFKVLSILNTKQFTYDTKDVDDLTHAVGTFTAGQLNTRDINLPRFERNDLQDNFYIYRNETISPYIEGQQDGVYHIFALNANNAVPNQFTDLKYSQNVVDLYPQLDRDNPNDNPSASVSFAKRSPLGDVSTNSLKDSLTRETADKILKDFGSGLKISSVGTGSNTAELTFDRAHNFGSLAEGTIGGSMSGYGNASYYDVKILSGSSTPTGSNWNGATANVTTSSGVINAVEIVDGGANYVAGTYYFDNTSITGNGGTYNVTADGIRGNIGDVVQVTGIGTETDSYSIIDSISNTTKISIVKTTGDPLPVAGQFLLHLGSPVTINTTDSTVGITTFTTTSAHGLSKGSAFRVLDTSKNNIGDFIVKERVGVNTFTATTTSVLTNSDLIIRHGMSANNASSDIENENLSTRGLSFYGGDVLLLKNPNGLGNGVTAADNKVKVSLPSSGIGTMSRFPLGSYIQVDNEIMRVASSTLGGTLNDELTVIRGVLGSNKAEHNLDSLITKVSPIPIEFRRPSILRASGHTFEYVGYGPGNYSTGLPQISDRTLTEREEFLAQSQETSCGTVVYTGMNDKGDFYIGNTKISADSGQQTTFDIPIPTVTGEDPSKLSVVFDEVIIKERLLVEGGSSKQILSQFNGPVTFNGITRVNNLFQSQTIKVGTSHTVYINNDDEESESNYDEIVCGSTLQGALQVKGGASIGKNLNICGKLGVKNNTASTNTNSGAIVTAGGVGIGGALNVGGSGSFAGNVIFNGGSHFPSNKLITFGGATANDANGWIYHDAAGSNNNFRVTADDDNTHLYLQSNNRVVIGNRDNTEQGLVYTKSDGAVKLYYGGSGSHVFETVTGGAKVTGQLDVTGDIIAYSASDHRLKDNITPIENPLEKILTISGNTFNWNQASNWEGKADTGLIAQEIEGLGLPGLHTIREDGTHAVDYEKVIPLLVESVKELTKRLEGLEHDLRFKK